MEDIDKGEMSKFYSLMKDHSFQSFLEWVQVSLTAEREHSDTITEFGDIRESQGKRLELRDMLEKLKEVVEVANK